MPRYVVDANVAAKWYFEEEYTDRAELLLASESELLAPDFLHLELAAITWKRVRRSEIDAATASQILSELREVPLELHRTPELTPSALALALESGGTVYDCLYLALAIQESCPLVTADRKFYERIGAGPFAPHIGWIADL